MHAPRHLREAFAEWVRAGVRDEHPIPWLLERLRRCTDIMEPRLCDDLDMPRGSTYGDAVRHIAPASDAAA